MLENLLEWSVAVSHRTSHLRILGSSHVVSIRKALCSLRLIVVLGVCMTGAVAFIGSLDGVDARGSIGQLKESHPNLTVLVGGEIWPVADQDR